MLEHRVFHRLSVRMPVRYAIAVRQARMVTGEGSTLNLSAGGMLLALADIPQTAVADLLEGLGTIEVTFELVPGQPVTGRCRLVWMQGPKRPGEGFELGLRFVDMPSATRERIHAFVTEPAR